MPIDAKASLQAAGLGNLSGTDDWSLGVTEENARNFELDNRTIKDFRHWLVALEVFKDYDSLPADELVIRSVIECLRKRERPWPFRKEYKPNTTRLTPAQIEATRRVEKWWLYRRYLSDAHLSLNLPEKLELSGILLAGVISLHRRKQLITSEKLHHVVAPR